MKFWQVFFESCYLWKIIQNFCWQRHVCVSPGTYWSTCYIVILSHEVLFFFQFRHSIYYKWYKAWMISCIILTITGKVLLFTQAQHLGQSFAIKNILLVNRVEIEVINDTAWALKMPKNWRIVSTEHLINSGNVAILAIAHILSTFSTIKTDRPYVTCREE